jgi:hypothetical protein
MRTASTSTLNCYLAHSWWIGLQGELYLQRTIRAEHYCGTTVYIERFQETHTLETQDVSKLRTLMLFVSGQYLALAKIDILMPIQLS